MANPPRTRKRVFGLLRAPDGSAFQKCDVCGDLVPVALYDMHDCDKTGKEFKRFKGVEKGHTKLKEKEGNEQSVEKEDICNQPRSAFCIFMESFRATHMMDDWRDVDQRGFEKWMHMSMKERWHFVNQADKVNLAYEKALLEEVDCASDSEVDDEADSAVVGKFDVTYDYWDNSDTSGSPLRRINSFDSEDWDMVRGWA